MSSPTQLGCIGELNISVVGVFCEADVRKGSGINCLWRPIMSLSRLSRFFSNGDSTTVHRTL